MADMFHGKPSILGHQTQACHFISINQMKIKTKKNLLKSLIHDLMKK